MDEKIISVNADTILDSRGKKTLSVSIQTNKYDGYAYVPSGQSTGANEARELRDPDGGVDRAIELIQSTISPALIGKSVTDQKGIDSLLIELDGTKTKERLGANSIIGISIATARAAASSKNKELFEYLHEISPVIPSRDSPLLFMNLLNGGLHAKNGLSFQEFHMIPLLSTIKEAYTCGIDFDRVLEEKIRTQYGSDSIERGDEGGLIFPGNSAEEALILFSQTADQLGVLKHIRFGIDVAASSFFKTNTYTVDGKDYSKESLLEFYGTLIESYPIYALEDPFEEEDYISFANLHELYPTLLVVGDDLTTTNEERLKNAIKFKSINALIIKPNQIGTLTETFATIQLARNNNIACIASHRSGETMDSAISDIAIAFGCLGIKAGAPHAKERAVKYRRLMEISKK